MVSWRSPERSRAGTGEARAFDRCPEIQNRDLGLWPGLPMPIVAGAATAAFAPAVTSIAVERVAPMNILPRC